MYNAQIITIINSRIKYFDHISNLIYLIRFCRAMPNINAKVIKDRCRINIKSCFNPECANPSQINNQFFNQIFRGWERLSTPFGTPVVIRNLTMDYCDKLKDLINNWYISMYGVIESIVLSIMEHLISVKKQDTYQCLMEFLESYLRNKKQLSLPQPESYFNYSNIHFVITKIRNIEVSLIPIEKVFALVSTKDCEKELHQQIQILLYHIKKDIATSQLMTLLARTINLY